MKLNKIAFSLACVFGAVSMLGATAFAQDASSEDESTQQEPETQKEEGLDFEQIIVTGTANWKKLTKFDASYGITTFDQEQMQEIAPQSTADLLGEVPGFFTEGGTAGEASNNAHVRGIPSAGGFKFLPLLTDGLPMFEEPEIGFMNNDVFIRADLMTKRVEAVRGGPSAILYSHALGGAANFITRTGSQEFEGAVKLEVGDWGHVRNEFFVSGPINDNVTFALGGFYRVSDGIRDPGYTGNDGGQLRGNIVWENDEADTRLEVHAHVLRDKTIFYQNIPFTIPAVGEEPTLDTPAYVENIQDLGVDLANGTMASNDLRTGTLSLPEGDKDYDLANGINPEFNIFTVKFSKDFSNWAIENNVRYTSGTSGFNAIFAGNPVRYQQFVSDRERNDVANNAFTAAQQCRLDSVYLSYFSVDERRCGDNLGVGNLDEFIDRYAGYSSFGAQYADNGEPVDLATTPYMAFQTLWLANVEADMFVDDFKIHSFFDFFGEHSATFGAYVSIYDLATELTISEFVTDVAENARKVNLVATTASGAQVGPSLTDNGIYRHANTHLKVSDKHQSYALYFHDDWRVNDELDISFGFRWQQLNIDSNYFFQDGGSNITPSDTDVGSTSDTLADNNVVGLSGRVQAREAKFTQNGWTLAANYKLTDKVAVFGRVSDSFRLPRSEVIWADRSSADPIQKIEQLEGGVKYLGDNVDAFITAFWNQFQATGSLHEYVDIDDPDCQVTDGNLIDLDTCRTAQGIARRGTENVGVEFEGNWSPDFLPGFSIGATVTYQDPEFSGGDVPFVEPVVEQQGDVLVTTGYEIRNMGIDGNIPRRFPKLMTNIRPRYNLTPSFHLPLTVYGTAQYMGERFGEDDNLIIYPDYWYFEAGVIARVTDDFTAQFHITNITDETVLTEGGNVDENNLTIEGDRNIVLGRPLLGRTMKLTLTYNF